MALTLSGLINEATKKETVQSYSGLISSVGQGGNNINLLTDVEERGIVSANPYGFVSSPIPDMLGYVVKGTGDEIDGLVGVYDYNRPTSLESGEVALYTKYGQMVKLDDDGNIHLNTPVNAKAYYNGVEIGSGGGSGTEEQVLAWIKKYAVTTYEDQYALFNLDDLLEERGLDLESIQEYIDEQKEPWANYVIGQVASNYVSLVTYNTKMAILDQAIGDLDIACSGVIQDLHDTKIFYDTVFVSNEQLKRVVYGDALIDFPTVYQCQEIPTLLNFPAVEWDAEDYEDHEGELALVLAGTQAGYFYIFVHEDNVWKWRIAVDSEVPDEYQTGYDGVIKSYLTTNYWTGTTTQSAITTSKDSIMLVVNTNKQQTDTTLAQHTTALGSVNTQIVTINETLTTHGTSIEMLSDSLTLKANQTDLVSVRDRTSALEQTTATHTSQIALVPSQITTTVTSAVQNIKVGCRNLIINSQTCEFTDYSFEETPTPTSTSLLGEMVLGDDALGD